MQAAVDAAHKAQGTARAAAAAEPVTEPMPRLQAAVAAQDWPTAGSQHVPGQRGDAWTFRLGADQAGRRSGGLTELDDADALDDLAESYLAADPDLTAGYADDTGLEDTGSHRLWSSLAVTTSGWDALGRDAEPGTDVRQERAAWWDHAVQSGRTGRAARPSKARQRLRPADAATPETATQETAVPETAAQETTTPAAVSAPAPSHQLPPPRPPKPERTLKPERARGQTAVPGSASITKPDSNGKSDRGVKVKPEPADVPAQPGRQDRAAQPSPAPAASRPRPSAPRRRRAATVSVALAVALVAGGAVALTLASRENASDTKVAQSSDSEAARIRAAARLAAAVASAATWVVAQVNHTTKVACDPVTCQALADHGFPGQGLDELGRIAVSPFSATIVVDTPALQRQFGTSLEANWAPTVLAGFGLGADLVTVRVLAPHGPHAYESALRADRKQRQAVGASLLTSSQITTTQAARGALAAGDVDDRLLLVITALASQHPIDILAFGRTWSDTSAGIPMRCAYLAAADPAAYLTESVYLQAVTGLLRAQPPAYRPVHFGLARLAGRKVLTIWFPAPSPLGLISANP